MGSKLRAGFFLAVMYGLGIVTGGVLQNFQHARPGRGGPFAAHRVERLKKELKLSPEQEKAVQEIFSKAQEKAKQVNEEVSWDLRDIRKESMEAIRKLLDPEQEKKFNEMQQRFKRRRDAKK